MIRYGKPSDVPALVELASLFEEEGSLPLKVDIPFFRTNLVSMIDHPHFFVCVAEDKGKVHGMLLAALNTMVLNPQPIAVEIGWFVKKEFRGRPENRKMVKAYEDWARMKGCAHISMSDVNTTGKLGALYNRMGYTHFESSYVKEL